MRLLEDFFLIFNIIFCFSSGLMFTLFPHAHFHLFPMLCNCLSCFVLVILCSKLSIFDTLVFFFFLERSQYIIISIA